MNTPKIRFKGFTDDWEQRKLGDVLICLQNNSFSRADLSNETGVAKNVHYGDVLVKFGEVLDVSKEQLPMISDERVLIKYKASFLQNGDVIVADTAEDSTVGKCSEIAGLNNEIVLSGLHTIPYRPKEKFASGYLGYYLNSDSYHNQLIPLMQGIKVTAISKSALRDTDIIYPESKEEQAKIGNYFQSLDHLITLHQRKCDETKQLKKFMLQKMFPKNGEKNPEIRFKGFTDDWEQRKLGELCNITTGKLDANAMVSDGQYDFYTSGIDVFKIDVAAFEGPAITIAGNGASVGYMHLADGKFNAYQRTYVLTDFLADRQFLNVAIGNELPNKIQEEVRGSGIPYIVLNMLTDLAIPFPSHEEQYAIGVYFQQLDHLITLHQRKCEKLKELKKFMLQNMFV